LAGATALKSAAVSISSDKPLWIMFLFIFLIVLLLFRLGSGEIVELNGDS